MYEGDFLEATEAGCWHETVGFDWERKMHRFSHFFMPWEGRGGAVISGVNYSTKKRGIVCINPNGKFPLEHMEFKVSSGKIYSVNSPKGLIALTPELQQRHRIVRTLGRLELERFEWMQGLVKKEFWIRSNGERGLINRVFLTDGTISAGNVEKYEVTGWDHRRKVVVENATFLILKPLGQDTGRPWSSERGTGYFAPQVDISRLAALIGSGLNWNYRIDWMNW